MKFILLTAVLIAFAYDNIVNSQLGCDNYITYGTVPNVTNYTRGGYSCERWEEDLQPEGEFMALRVRGCLNYGPYACRLAGSKRYRANLTFRTGRRHRALNISIYSLYGRVLYTVSFLGLRRPIWAGYVYTAYFWIDLPRQIIWNDKETIYRIYDVDNPNITEICAVNRVMTLYE